MTLDQAKEKIAQAYQVIGVLAYADGIDIEVAPSYSEIQRAQDYFASEDFDPAFLPWPK